MAHIQISKAQSLEEDRIVIDKEARKAEDAKWLEGERLKKKEKVIKVRQEDAAKRKIKDQASSGANKPVNDPRGKKDFLDLIGKETSTVHNDIPIENALSLKDLDMALHYVLDQLVPLDTLATDIVLYFNLK